MNIQEQLQVLLARGVEFVIVGGQAGVLRQAVEFSHDLDILIHATRDNAERVRAAVREIAHRDPDVDLILGRDFQQYVDEASGLQTRLLALGVHDAALGDNPHLHPTARALLALDAASRAKLVTPPGRLAALLARVPLVLPEQGYRLRARV